MAELLSTHRRRRGRRFTGLFTGRVTSEAGVGVPTALFVSLIVFTLGLSWTRLGIHNSELSSHERSREQALHAAEAGLHQAMSRLTTDVGYEGQDGNPHGGTVDYDVTVEPMDPGDPNDRRRLIRAVGYAPDRDARFTVQRRVEAEVDLVELDGFRYALFAGVGELDGDNHMTVFGDVYGADGVDLRNNTDIYGNVISPGWVTTSGNTLITGDVRAGGNVSLENKSTTIQGSVFSGGDAYINVRVMGDVQAAGAVTLGPVGQVDGSIASYSSPPPVRVESLPEFTWDPDNYTPTPSTWSTTASFYEHWRSTIDAGSFSGHHRINATSILTLDRKWSMGGDVTIVSDGRVELSREVTNATSGTLHLVVVSFSEDGIGLTQNVTIPDSIRVVLFAPNGPVEFRNLKHFAGSVYGESVSVDQNFTLSWALPDVPGFSWAETTDVHYQVVMRVLREVPALGAGG